MRSAISPAHLTGDFAEDIGLKFQLEPLREVLHSRLFEDLLRDIWEPRSCFQPPVSDPDLTLTGPEGLLLPEVVAEIREKIVRHAVHPRHAWSLAHMTPPPVTASVLADLIVGALNQCAFIWEEAPLAKALEVETVDWLARRLGLPIGATGLLTSGGTLSNCLAAYLALAQYRERFGGGRPVALIASDQSHLSLQKAAALVGAGADAVFCATTDAEGRLSPGGIEAAALRAVREGRQPFLFVCTAGTSNAGVLEPPGEFLRLARSYGAWFHVDASHGGVMALGGRPHPMVSEWVEADSISWDPHKSLYVSYSVGALLLRHERLRAPLEFHSEYALKEDGRQHDAGVWHFEGSRRLEALKLWMVIRHLGDTGLDELTDRSLSLAREFAALVRAANDFHLITSPDTNVVCFRFVDGALEDADLDQVNLRLQKHLYRTGGPLVSSTRIGGRVTLRAVLLNPLLEAGQLGEILEAIRSEAWRQIDALEGVGL